MPPAETPEEKLANKQAAGNRQLLLGRKASGLRAADCDPYAPTAIGIVRAALRRGFELRPCHDRGSHSSPAPCRRGALDAARNSAGDSRPRSAERPRPSIAVNPSLEETSITSRLSGSPSRRCTRPTDRFARTGGTQKSMLACIWSFVEPDGAHAFYVPVVQPYDHEVRRLHWRSQLKCLQVLEPIFEPTCAPTIDPQPIREWIPPPRWERPHSELFQLLRCSSTCNYCK